MATTKVTGMMSTGTKGGDIPSASTLVIDTDGDYFDITGTTGITAMTVDAGRRFTLQFDGAVTLTHGSSLYLPGATSFTTEANDCLSFIATAANTVRCTGYALKDGGSPVAPVVADNSITLAKMAGGTDGQIITYDASGDPVAVGPGSDGQVLTSTGAGSPPAFEAAAAGGIVLQTKMHKLTVVSSFTANHTFTDTGLTVSITPSSTNSKIWVQGTINVGQQGYGGIRIVRDSTAIGVPTESIGSRAGCTTGSQQTGAYECSAFPFNWIDAPSSTSSLTYKIQWHHSGSDTVYVNRQYNDGDDPDNTRTVSTIIVSELSAATIS